MRLSNGEVLLRWPLAQHIITQGWYYNDGSLHQAIDLRTQIDNMYIRPVYAAEDGTVDQTQDWDGHTRTGMQSYGNMVRIKHAPKEKGRVLYEKENGTPHIASSTASRSKRAISSASAALPAMCLGRTCILRSF